MGLVFGDWDFGIGVLGIRVSGVGTRVWRCRAVSGAVLEGLLRESRS